MSPSNALYTCLTADVAHILLKGKVSATTPGASYSEVAASLQCDALLRKFAGDVSPDADNRALEKFTRINAECAVWEPGWQLYEDELMGEVKNQVYRFWTPEGLPLVSDLYAVVARGRTGPGAAVKANGNDFYTKLFSSSLSCTSAGLYETYRRYVDNFPRWRDAENQRQRSFGEGLVVEGSRLHFVPKRVDISRLICIEPSLNQFYQLGFGAHLEDRLGRYYGIYLDRQPDISRELARQGSINDNLVTIDLESASDSISLRMLEWLLPRDFLAWLKLFRCPVSSIRGEQVALNMVSTMGNGFTFPLQTMIFASVVFACARVAGVSLHRSSTRECNYSVFGDDIICPREIAGNVMRVLKHLGFTVNKEKTFVEGPFRESCGSDWFKGRNVRPVYIKKLDSQQDRFVAINMLNLWSAKTGIYLPSTIQWLLSRTRYQPVPPAENPDAGVWLPSSMLTTMKRSSRTGSLLYRADRSVTRELVIDVDKEVVKTPGKARRREFNPEGLWLAFLRGDVVSGRVGIRHDVNLYRAKWATTPYWDWLPPVCAIAAQSDWQRWNSAVFFNHTG